MQGGRYSDLFKGRPADFSGNRQRSTWCGVFDSSGKAAVVTGAGSGIGAAIASLFARQHARVIIMDLDEAAASRTAERIRQAGGAVEPVACDVADARQVVEVFQHLTAAHRRLDILVNNAGIAHVGTIEGTSEADLDRLCRVNVKRVSQFMTLLPGDIISTGTPPGVGLGMRPPVYLKAGDVVALGIEELGQSSQKVVDCA